MACCKSILQTHIFCQIYQQFINISYLIKNWELGEWESGRVRGWKNALTSSSRTFSLSTQHLLPIR
jgi:hypothetical protein